jgi:hypothetical protein
VTIQKQLREIELQLTPRQWAIRLADDMRQHFSEEDFLKTIAKSTYREAPYLKPFYMLAQQAEERCPGRNPKNVHAKAELNRKLREEFQALKTLINNVNKAIAEKARTNKLKAALQASNLHALTLQDALHVSITEAMPADPASPARLRHSSLLQDWADDSAILLMETVAHQAAVPIVQESYFENHPILFRDIEGALEGTIQTVRDAILLFAKYQEYQEKLADPLSRGLNQESQNAGTGSVVPGERKIDLLIDIAAIEERGKEQADVIVDEWVMIAKNEAKADILEETGQHEDFLWQNFRKRVGLK